ncbi:MAG: molybdopterin converting factor subunit 1 [Pirellulales bacterium]|nr:molybdopterin converting factor subunit 1 [Pirellulales bacterium]
MQITVKLFAVARQLAGADTIDVALPADATVSALRTAIAAQHPALERIVGQLKFAVNADYATDETTLTEEQEIACIPPVSGG